VATFTEEIKTIMIYTQVLNKGGLGVMGIHPFGEKSPELISFIF